MTLRTVITQSAPFLTLFIVLLLGDPAAAEESPDQPSSFLEQFFAAINDKDHGASGDDDADLDLDPSNLWLPDAPGDRPQAWDIPAEIPPAPVEPQAVFDRQPEDSVFEIALRETFAYDSFAYEDGTPTISCMPARVCSIELEPGEIVLGRAMGDPDRWLYQELSVGEGDDARVLLAFMPKAFGARTNLILTTDRRVYTLALRSADVEKGDDAPSVPLTERARFHYPLAWAEARPRPEPDAALPVPAPEDSTEGASLSASPEHLNFHYTISDPRPRKRRFSWRPTVYDDGVFTYVLLPGNLGALPAVRGRDDNDTVFLLNETYHHDGHRSYIEIPRLASTLELVLGTGRDSKVMTIHRNVRLP